MTLIDDARRAGAAAAPCPSWCRGEVNEVDQLGLQAPDDPAREHWRYGMVAVDVANRQVSAPGARLLVELDMRRYDLDADHLGEVRVFLDFSGDLTPDDAEAVGRGLLQVAALARAEAGR